MCNVKRHIHLEEYSEAILPFRDFGRNKCAIAFTNKLSYWYHQIPGIHNITTRKWNTRWWKLKFPHFVWRSSSEKLIPCHFLFNYTNCLETLERKWWRIHAKSRRKLISLHNRVSIIVLVEGQETLLEPDPLWRNPSKITELTLFVET